MRLVYGRLRDSDLLIRAATGDLDAASRMFDRLGAAVLAVARVLLGPGQSEQTVEAAVSSAGPH
ncbi:hypothetical protein [Nocardioides bigeumensis]|uniref:Uncharacterized protein n=1 Tax=Nocardioides bigeumensis TaxID=433657 RepID=A0ABP5JST6_9ACTN